MRLALRLAFGALAIVVVVLLIRAYEDPRRPQIPDRGPPEIGVHARSIRPAEVERIAAAGLREIRTTFSWHRVQPERDGPWDWEGYDALMESSAEHGVGVIPVLIGTPRWASDSYQRQPLTKAGIAGLNEFVRLAVARYGPKGRFWRRNPDLPHRPLRAWQVWNEPNLNAFWAGRLDPRAYAELLRTVRGEILEVDPRARIVLAGMPRSVVDYPIDEYLADLYRLPGFAKLFDVAAIHGYAQDAGGLAGLISDTRALLDRNGDREKPIWITEFGWSAAGPARDRMRVRDRVGQARELRAAVQMLRRRARPDRVEKAIWYDLRDTRKPPDEPDRFVYHTGLFDLEGRPKPAWSALAEVLGGRDGEGSIPAEP